jgi:peptidoglycan hydrolase-like protein with peptidoglycan-binding domain
MAESPAATARSRSRRLTGIVLVATLLLAAAAGIGWAVRELTMPVPAPPAAAATSVAVTQGEVGSVLTLGATVEWSETPLPVNRATGTVTALPADDATVEEGGTLYSVDLLPVILGTGDVPMYRDIGAGATGEDVAQLQRLLTHLGRYDGPEDGTAGRGTVAAIMAWQKASGRAADGVVRLGDVVFAPSAPLRLTPAADLHLGDVLTGGERILARVSEDPVAYLTVTENQRALVGEGMRVTASPADGVAWRGHLGAAHTDAGTGATRLPIEPDGEGAFCGEECDRLRGRTTLLIDVFQNEPVAGLTVPVTAIDTDPAGATTVVRSDGRRVAVDVLGAADGMAAIASRDLRPGDRVLIQHHG